LTSVISSSPLSEGFSVFTMSKDPRVVQVDPDDSEVASWTPGLSSIAISLPFLISATPKRSGSGTSLTSNLCALLLFTEIVHRLDDVLFDQVVAEHHTDSVHPRQSIPRVTARPLCRPHPPGTYN